MLSVKVCHKDSTNLTIQHCSPSITRIYLRPVLWHLLPQARFVLQQCVLHQNCGVLLAVQMQSVVGENEGVCIIRWHYPDIPGQPASPFYKSLNTDKLTRHQIAVWNLCEFICQVKLHCHICHFLEPWLDRRGNCLALPSCILWLFR